MDTAPGDYFVRFLDARKGVPAEQVVKGVITELLDARAGMAVLDVGSGTGDDLLGIAGVVGIGGRAVGVDVSTAMVAEARRRTAKGVPAEFVVGDATRLDFADACFDRVRAERVLMALADPEAAVREMARVVRPGGVVVLSEVDAATVFVNSSDRELVQAVERGFADDLPTPDAGRRLQRMLLAAGLTDVRLETTVLQNTVAFLRFLFGNRVSALAGEARAAAFWEELEQGEREGWLCSGGVCFTAAGYRTTV
ncbi:methyltransferase domain-containing protein [Kribbella sp. NPDC056951]|uniref:methyltransferase domain-containing protein n=1 Tax=Kribbella sp. NPDC056951 TaxID=3345978 RepID=UPI00362FADE9